MKVHLSDKRKEVKIKNEDVYSFDYTLAHIIHPGLLLLKEKESSPLVDDEDVPEELRRSSTKVTDGFIDEFWIDRWNYVLDEMIWVFNEYITEDIWINFTQEYNDRVNNALRLFGKYFRNLWY